MADTPPSLLNTLTALGGVSALTGLLGWLTGHRLQSASVRKTNAETRKAEAETESLTEGHSAEFEKAVNDRVKALLDSWEKQVGLLTTRIESQQEEIHGLRQEVVELRKALDATTKELHKTRMRTHPAGAHDRDHRPNAGLDRREDP